MFSKLATGCYQCLQASRLSMCADQEVDTNTSVVHRQHPTCAVCSVEDSPSVPVFTRKCGSCTLLHPEMGITLRDSPIPAIYWQGCPCLSEIAHHSLSSNLRLSGAAMSRHILGHAVQTTHTADFVHPDVDFSRQSSLCSPWVLPVRPLCADSMFDMA